MGGAIDRLGALILDATLAASALLVVLALAMVGTAQPVRRCALARGAILGLLALLPLAEWTPIPRIVNGLSNVVSKPKRPIVILPRYSERSSRIPVRTFFRTTHSGTAMQPFHAGRQRPK